MSKFRSVALLLVVLILPIAILSVHAQGVPSEQVTRQAKDQLSTKVSGDLVVLQIEYTIYRQANSQEAFQASNSLLRGAAGHVVIDATAAGDADALLADLEALGLQKGISFERIVSGQLPIISIKDLDSLDSLNFARPSYAATRVGLVDSQADAAMRSDDARLTFGVDGTGITVGTLSDSYDCLGGAADDVTSGDLPSGITVLKEESGCGSGSDEGRAMMQLIADVAPGSDQAFHTAFDGMADFANGIIELANAGSDVIVDDVGYFSEPFFQDGIVAQAVNTVVGMGVPYFSSAGNDGRQSYQSTYVSSGTAPLGGTDYHDFNPGGGVDVYQNVTIPVGAEVTFILQWDQPFFSVSGAPGSANDVDIVLFDDPATTALALSDDGNIGADPVEIFNFTNPGPDTSFNIVIDAFDGPDPGLIKYIYLGDMTINEYDTASSAIYGHPNAAGAEAVGAAFYDNTPEFGTDPALLEPFSSAGRTPILFTVGGAPTSVLRNKPEIVAPDGTNNTFFGGDDVEPDGFPNFFGTSAAAPHAAAVAALMVEASGGTITPANVYATLEMTAADMLTPGFDDDSGFGLVQADLAVGAAIPPSQADLVLSKVDDVDPVVAGNQLTYTVNVLNNGPDAAAGIVLTDTLPTGVSFVSSTPGSPTCTEAGGIVTCGLGTLTSSANTDVIIVVDVNPGASGIITNKAMVSTTANDPNLPNVASEDTIVNDPSKENTTTALTTSQNPSVFGKAVIFRATVTPATTAGSPTGSVIFKDGATVLGTRPLNSSRKAAITTSNLAIGTHTITAQYSGDSNYNASSGTLSPDQVIKEEFIIILPVVLKA